MQGDLESKGAGERWPNAACVVAAADTEQQWEWAVFAAIGLARKLARERSRVVVADLGRGDRSLRDRLLPNGPDEGIVDVLFRGLSFTRVARKPAAEGFYYLGLGTEPPASGDLFGDARWERIAGRFREADAHLLLLVPWSEWRSAGAIRGVDRVIFLNGSGRELTPPPGLTVAAEYYAPPDIRDPVPPSEYEDVEADPEPRIVDDDAHPESVGAVAPGPAADLAGRITSGYSFSARLPRQRGPLIAVGAVVVLLMAAVLWAIGTRELTPSPDTVEAAAGATIGSPSAGGGAGAEGRATRTPASADLALPYSVLIASYSSFEDAWARQRGWERTGVPFYVAPTVVRGVVYYRVFAGMLPEREGAVSLMRSLVDRGIKEAERDWDVRPAGLAYDFGTFDDRAAARGAVERLLREGIPAYIVPAGGAGPEGGAFRVYAGGYERREDAVPLEQQIARSDLSAELVERVGRIEP